MVIDAEIAGYKLILRSQIALINTSEGKEYYPLQDKNLATPNYREIPVAF